MPRVGGSTAKTRAFFDALAPARDRFKARNWYYYRRLTAFFRFVVPPGQRVLEMGQRGPHPAEQPWQRPRHPQLLGARAELDRLDPVRHQVRAPRHRGEAECSRRCVGKPPQQVLDVGLVTRACTPEDVGVDHHQRRAL